MVKKENAITMIAPIITIIILIMLAGIMLNVLTGDDGIFNKAKEAETTSTVEQAKKEIEEKIIDVQVKKKGKATLQNVVEYLQNNNDLNCMFSLKKTASIDKEIYDVADATEVYVTYNNIEFAIDNNLIVNCVDVAKTGKGDNVGTSRRYANVKIVYAHLSNMIIGINDIEIDSIKNIEFYFEGELVQSGLDTTYETTGLEMGKEYTMYAIIEYFGEKKIITATTKSTPQADIYVSTTGNDTTGDGSSEKPYLTLSNALNKAENENKICIMPGTYNLEKISIDSASQVGIYDYNKKLEIFGFDGDTILKFDATQTTARDGAAFTLSNSNTVVRNLVYEYMPKGSDSYCRSIFRWTNGSIYNIFMKISGSNAATYSYYNGQSVENNVVNCTFFHSTGMVYGSYSGSAKYTNIATNVNTNGTNSNVKIKSFGTSTSSIEELIENSKNDSDFVTNKVGVFYGDYAWGE